MSKKIEYILPDGREVKIKIISRKLPAMSSYRIYLDGEEYPGVYVLPRDIGRLEGIVFKRFGFDIEDKV